MLNKRYIKSIKRDIFCYDSCFNFFCYILERKDKKSFKRIIFCFNFRSILSRSNEILLC